MCNVTQFIRKAKGQSKVSICNNDDNDNDDNDDDDDADDDDDSNLSVPKS